MLGTMQNTPVEDSTGRQFTYLRLSITDACNFRCVYCLPDGSHSCSSAALSSGETEHLVTALTELGIQKIRLTGGEPTLRHDLIDLATRIRKVSGVEKLGITTNGYRLRELARPLRDAGIEGLNVSVDTLSQKRFFVLTGHDLLNQVLEGIETAQSLRFPSIKINTVLMKNYNISELDAFFSLAKSTGFCVRFIELMRTQSNKEFFDQQYISSELVTRKLEEEGWKRGSYHYAGGPAHEYTHPIHPGTIGIITPYSKDFCLSCNRLRVTSRGELRLCLFGNRNYPLRQLLKTPDQKPELQAFIIRLLKHKPASHLLSEGSYGNTTNLAAFGG
ncbi:MAG: GTP 3',8-cyclase MoaA [Deltaproteobacteria bacterium]|nr:GTP 3',8-cyclase MoaA [Deltaproteobacteria bacterium]